MIDRAIQAHGAAGVSGDLPLAAAWVQARATRILDGPDEVHRETVAKLELKGAGRRWVRGQRPGDRENTI